MNHKVVIIPTYDERDNVRPISEAIFRASPQTDILFVDDNSPDGTGNFIEEMMKTEQRINVIHNPAKAGLGRAYIGGYKWALQRPYRFVIGMDADFSHDPCEIPNLERAAEGADLVIGSRYIDGIRITNWPLSRLILSKMAGAYVRTITGMPILDPTGGYRCYRREVLESMPLDSIISNGYSFLVETAYTTWISGFRIAEIPITFEDRRSGYSKMNMDIAKESMWIVWKLAFRNGFRRRPHGRPQAGKK
ncbi:MAG: dolichyl-phosphate beta-D-mannosyltransferase [Verrucomicrobia bacterium]|nr:dolichyl-phosphate beta-D-mannosyltransferase [Verrucomicrobiota bacterium]